MTPLPPLFLTRFSSSSPPPPDTDCPVPFDQQPLNEYETLAASVPFSWASADLRRYVSRLLITGASFSLFVGLPVAGFGVLDPGKEALRCALGAVSAGLLAVTLAVVRIYLGWAYVGNRLLSATVEYEETGWYDGQIWVKTPEVLARDRLVGSFSVSKLIQVKLLVIQREVSVIIPVTAIWGVDHEGVIVKPVLSRVKTTLIGLAVSLVACFLLFINTESPKEMESSSKDRVIAGVYNDDSARSFEPDAFHVPIGDVVMNMKRKQMKLQVDVHL
ncbi:hypothetical protein ACLOJK_020977 [Asimina triloba]